MLCTAHWVSWLTELNKTRSSFRLVREMKEFLRKEVPKDSQPPWSVVHLNPPCTVWTRESLSNYDWHHRLMGHLLDEYTVRYGKMHKSLSVWEWLEKPPPNLSDKGLTNFAICMPEDYKISTNAIDCYREYYLKDKVRFAKWKYTQEPHWGHKEKV